MKTIITIAALSFAFAFASLAQAKGHAKGGLQGTTHTGHAFPSKGPKAGGK